jgi:hypothetical protein
MKKTLVAVTILLSVSASSSRPAFGQVAVAPRVGTLGIAGGEVMLGFAERFELRAGVGMWFIEATTEFDEVPIRVGFPDLSVNVGIDYYLNETFRFGGGLLLRRDYPTLKGDYEVDDVINIGGLPLTATEVGALTGVVTSNKQAAYVLIGFGRPTGSGLGLSLDVGAAFLGDPSVSLSAQGGTYPEDDLAGLLAAEEVHFEDDMKTYFRIWPILGVALRYAF